MKERRARVLVIDDDPRFGRLVARVLEREHEVLVTTDARGALGRIGAGERFDLILCDVMMPEMMGADFQERLACVAPAMLDRVLYVTGGAFTPRAVELLAQACVRRLDKPLEIAELRAVIREHLRRLAREP